MRKPVRTPERVARMLLATARRNSKARGHPAPSLSLRTCIRKLEAGTCEVTGLPFDLSGGLRRGPFAPSLDRINSARPYTGGNTKLVLWAINSANGDWGWRIAEKVAIARLRSRGYIVTTPRPSLRGIHARLRLGD